MRGGNYVQDWELGIVFAGGGIVGFVAGVAACILGIL